MSEENESHPPARSSGGEGRSEHSSGGGPPDKRRMQQRPRYRRKVLDTRNLVIDYKSADVLERFLSRTGKILPRRMTGANAKIQRKISREIKRARMINLLPLSRRS